MPDGGCISTLEWQCPDPEEQFGLDPHSTVAAPSVPASAVASQTADVGVITQSQLFNEPQSAPTSELPQIPEVLHRPSPLVLGLGGTAVAIMALIVLLSCFRLFAQLRQRSKRAGAGPAGSTRRRAKHTKLSGSEASSSKPARAAHDDDDDDDDEVDDEEIIGDDYDAEMARTNHPEAEAEGSPAKAECAATKPIAAMPSVGVSKEQADLLKKVHSLLDEIPMTKHGEALSSDHHAQL